MNPLFLQYLLYHNNMTSSRDNMSMDTDTEIACKNFTKNISYSIFNRILGMISLLFIIVSSIFLLLCYWLLTGSKYVEKLMVDICADMDLFCFQSVANDTIQSVSDTVNDWFGTRSFVSKTNIKSEFASMLERHLAPDLATDLATDSTSEGTSDEDNHPVNEDDVEIKKEPIVLNEELKNESNEDSSDSSNESIKEDSDEEIEDVTEKILAEKRIRFEVLDLTNEDEAKSYMTI